jgi:RNA polymerase sigma-B factor
VPHPQIAEPRESMIVQHLPLADGSARRYGYTSEPLDDLTQVARLGLLKAVERWGPERGTAFSSFAVPRITGELQRHFRDRAWAIRPRATCKSSTCAYSAPAPASRPSSAASRPPATSPRSWAAQSRRSSIRWKPATPTRHGHSTLPSRPIRTRGATELDRVPDRRAELARSENATALWQLGQVLDERSWEVVRLRFQEDLLQREIAERVGCSQMHVSRILRDAIARLHRAADEAGVVFD